MQPPSPLVVRLGEAARFQGVSSGSGYRLLADATPTYASPHPLGGKGAPLPGPAVLSLLPRPPSGCQRCSRRFETGRVRGKLLLIVDAELAGFLRAGG